MTATPYYIQLVSDSNLRPGMIEIASEHPQLTMHVFRSTTVACNTSPYPDDVEPFQI